MSKSKVKNDSSCDSDKKQLNHASGDGIKMNESALSNNSTTSQELPPDDFVMVELVSNCTWYLIVRDFCYVVFFLFFFFIKLLNQLITIKEKSKICHDQDNFNTKIIETNRKNQYP